MIFDVIPGTVEDQELNTLEHYIADQNLTDKVFAFLPNKEMMMTTYTGNNYYCNKLNYLLSLFRNPKAKDKILDYLKQTAPADSKAKMDLVSHSLTNPITILTTPHQSLALINFKKLEEEKNKILDNEFMSIRRNDPDYTFYQVLLTEVQVRLGLYNDYQLDINTPLTVQHYISTAALTIRKYMELYGENQIGFLFEYFFIKFNNNFEHIGSHFNTERTRLMASMAFEIGGYTMAK
jgi:hypothetical protein